MICLGAILLLLQLFAITLVPYGRWGVGIPLERWQMIAGGILLIVAGVSVIFADIRCSLRDFREKTDPE